jgi:ribosomal protein S27E
VLHPRGGELEVKSRALWLREGDISQLLFADDTLIFNGAITQIICVICECVLMF